MSIFDTLRLKWSSINVLRTYLATVEGSVGSNEYRHLYQKRGGKDMLQNGEVACTYHVSCLLLRFGLISSWYTWLPNALTDMQKCGWVEGWAEKDWQPGAVLVWHAKPHRHIGFYVGEDLAVSTDFHLGQPTKRDWRRDEITGVWHLPSLYA